MTPTRFDGHFFKAARICAGLSQAELAERAGLHRNSVSRVERLACISRRDHAAERIAIAFAGMGISLTWNNGETLIRVAENVHI